MNGGAECSCLCTLILHCTFAQFEIRADLYFRDRNCPITLFETVVKVMNLLRAGPNNVGLGTQFMRVVGREIDILSSCWHLLQENRLKKLDNCVSKKL